MAAKKRKKIIQFSEFASEPIDWIWPGWIAAGKVTLVDGDPGEGKSLLTLDLVSRLTAGRPLPDGYTPARPVSAVLVGAEDGIRDTVLPRLQAAGADVGRVHSFVGQSEEGAWDRLPTFPDDCDLLQETLEETSARLVIVDPLTAFLSGGLSGINDQRARRALARLGKVAVPKLRPASFPNSVWERTSGKLRFEWRPERETEFRGGAVSNGVWEPAVWGAVDESRIHPDEQGETL